MTAPLPASAAEYLNLGYCPIPLTPNTKRAAAPGWQRRSPHELWQNAPEGANVGLRGAGGDGPAFIDCDDKAAPGTLERIQRWLTGLGYLPDDYPLIRTASGKGGHIYLYLMGSLPQQTHLLAPDIGAGEFRHGPGAYVVAPPSQVNGAAYEQIAGDLRQLPRLAVSDLLPILKNPTGDTPSPISTRIPRTTLKLLRGEGVDRYASRSEAEAAIMLGLINAGHDYSQALYCFNHYPAAGKYQEQRARNPRDAERWLHRVYHSAKQKAAGESEPRRRAQVAITWANTIRWPGRTGRIDRAVFLAHASIAHQAGKQEWHASTRDLAERAGVNSAMTASTATNRLCTQGIIEQVRPSTAKLAALYTWGKRANLYTPYPPSVRECTSLHNHDAFRWGGLGKSSAEILTTLKLHGPMSAVELAQATGLHRTTVKRRLEELTRLADTVTGEYLPLVEKNGDRWQAVQGYDLERIAQAIGTAGAGKRQKEKHAAERKAHHRALALRQQNPPNNDTYTLDSPNLPAMITCDNQSCNK